MNFDTVADTLTRIRNAQERKLEMTELPYSNMNESIVNLLKQYGFVEDVSIFKEKGKSYKSISVKLRYEDDGRGKIRSIERISKPGLRQYKKAKDIRPVLNGLGIYIVSTSRGVMSSVEAKKKNLGGEIVCRVY